ncbi:hypothetical protein RM844_22670 [Streptomyces sp. DSM 44915]|uniref:Uncharacterized protein n=1 Tax=Streptomyces chisholmiae TaxID=3075540 RepID=A0ABU2JVT0_9ACTN|nr:hypothetical protein [Streptomyces sp. DSM 44915]MDT0269095.1 hypothetical protein [Streptomyces sp. DSM 44915]
MRKDGRLRRLVVGDTTWWWSVRHKHRPACHEVLSLHRQHHPGGRTTLRILFPAGPGRFVAEGHWYAGSVTNGQGDLLNLHEPGVVHQFLQAAAARGLVPEAPGETRLDGWPLFDSLIGR